MKVYDCFNNTFLYDCGTPYLNLPPMPIDDSHRPKKDPIIPLTQLHIPFLLPLENMLGKCSQLCEYIDDTFLIITSYYPIH